MTLKAQKVLDYIDKQVTTDQDSIKILQEKMKKSSFVEWSFWNWSDMVIAEMSCSFWMGLKSKIALQDIEQSDLFIKDFLMNFRNDLTKRILRNVNKNSTNRIALEIDFLKEDTLKRRVGLDCNSPDSLAELLYSVFGEEV